jgi:hypothetical protein
MHQQHVQGSALADVFHYKKNLPDTMVLILKKTEEALLPLAHVLAATVSEWLLVVVLEVPLSIRLVHSKKAHHPDSPTRERRWLSACDDVAFFVLTSYRSHRGKHLYDHIV